MANYLHSICHDTYIVFFLFTNPFVMFETHERLFLIPSLVYFYIAPWFVIFYFKLDNWQHAILKYRIDASQKYATFLKTRQNNHFFRNTVHLRFVSSWPCIKIYCNRNIFLLLYHSIRKICGRYHHFSSTFMHVIYLCHLWVFVYLKRWNG